jgi:hypothetical protein
MTSKPNVAFEIADLLMDSMGGFALLHELREQFPHAKRDDVFLAISIAWAHQQAGWLADHVELGQARI